METAIIRVWTDEEWPRGGGQGELQGVLTWELDEGSECTPGQAVASVSYGDWSLSIAADTFGRLGRLLVPDGATVSPGEPLAEIHARLPTTDEYLQQREARFDAERHRDRYREALRNPFRAFWVSLTKQHLRRD